MADPDGFESTQSSSNSLPQHNGLFPSLVNNNNIQNFPRTSYDGDYSEGSDSSNSESFVHLRNVFLPHQSSGKLQMEEVDLSQDSGFDPGAGLSPVDEQSTVSRISLESSVVDEMAENIMSNGNTHVNGGAFKFLRLYERTYKQKRKNERIRQITDNMKNQEEIPLQTMNSNSSSVFHLSNLDDFTKYVKETALNDELYARMAKKLPQDGTGLNNQLNVIQETDLADNFYAGSEMEHQKRHARSRLKGWIHNKNFNPLHATNSEVSELNYNANKPISPSSSDEGTKRRFLQRSLKVRHLQMISLGGTLGVGLILNSGKAFTIAGGFGATLAFFIMGLIVLATMMSFCEMVTFVSVVDGVSGLSSRFVDDAFGFAAGWLYFFCFAFGVAGEIVAGVIMLSFFPNLQTTKSQGSAAGFVTFFFVAILGSNLLDIRIFGEIEYMSSLIKVLFISVMMIVMIILNRGGMGGDVLGFRYWTHSKSDFENNIIFGLFRPTFNLHDTGTSSPTEGIGGDLGRFMSFLVALLVVAYAYSGTEIVCIAACEAKNPRKTLPSATKRVFWRILLFYVLATFLVSLNIYAGDPRLLRYIRPKMAVEDFQSNPAINAVGGIHCNFDPTYFAGYPSGAQSPWIVALQSVGQCRFGSVVNAFWVFFAVSCGNAQLYVSSRTVYSLSLQGKAPRFLSYCNRYGTPYNAVLLAGSFGLFAYSCVSESATVVFQNLSTITASSVIFIWFAMCLTYIRFYYGLKRRPDILSRDDESYPFKSPFQPYTALVGLVGTGSIIFASGYTVFLTGEWNTLFFFSSYGTLIAFAILYLAYRLIKGTSIPSLDRLDFDAGRTEMDRYIWDAGRDYNVRSFKDVAQKILSFLA